LNQFPEKPDVIVLSETWFSDSVTSEIDEYKGFHTFRCNRVGGGISIYVKNTYKCNLINSISKINDSSEICSVKMKINNKNVKIVAIYRPPDNNVEKFTETMCDIMSSFHTSDHVFLVGDLNIDLIDPNLHELEFINSCNSFSYSPLVTDPTHVSLNKSSCIDHVWYNQMNEFVAGTINLGITDHHFVYSSVDIGSGSKLYNKKFRDHSSNSLQSLQEDLLMYANSFEIHCNDNVHQLTQNVLNKFQELYNNSCPIRSKCYTLNRKLKPWINKELITCVNYKHFLFRQYKRGLTSFEHYNTYKNFVTRLTRKVRSAYFHNKFKENMGNPRQTWKTLKSLSSKQNKRDTPNEIKVDGNSINEPKIIAESFNTYFSMVGTNIDDQIPVSQNNPLEFMNPPNQNSFFSEPVTSNEVALVIKNLKNKACDLQSVPIFIYKRFSEIISPLIAKLYNLSISGGVFPDCLKVAKIVPVFKAGDPQLMNNYRPISILQTMSKIFEKLMYNKLQIFIVNNKLLSLNQFGFRKNSNTADAILQFLDAVHHSQNDKKVLMAIFIDFAKAFDTVNYEILLKKLFHLGFRGVVQDWFKSYLNNRNQYVIIEGEESQVSAVSMGVPQGSILGPLLFLIYINDMQNCMKILNLVHFADDTTAYHSNSNVNTLVNEVNSELLRLNNWLKCNRLSLNVNKTFYMLFTDRRNLNVMDVCIEDRVIQETSVSKFLGIQIDNKLSFCQHFENVCKSISKSVGMLRRLSYSLPYKTKISIYYALIYAKINYGVVAYGTGNKTNRKILERLLIRAHRLVNCQSQFNGNSHKFLTFDSIFSYFTTIKLFKSLRLEQHQHFANCYRDLTPVHDYGTRFFNSAKLTPPQFSKSKCQKSFIYSSIKIWNSLPEFLRNCETLEIFKKHLKDYLLSQQTV